MEARVQVIRPEAIERGTGRPWAEWLDFLERVGAKDLPHKEIAERVVGDGATPWWAQTVTVAYEQHLGRREPGQDCDGAYSVSVSKTLTGSMDEALARWRALMAGRGELSDVPVSRGPDVSRSDKWRYWRCGLADGSRVNVSIYQKSPEKAGLGIEHERLESADTIEHWRAYWKSMLKEL